MVLAGEEIAPTEKRTRQRTSKIGEQEEPIRMGTLVALSVCVKNFEVGLSQFIGVDRVDGTVGYVDPRNFARRIEAIVLLLKQPRDVRERLGLDLGGACLCLNG